MILEPHQRQMFALIMAVIASLLCAIAGTFLLWRAYSLAPQADDGWSDPFIILFAGMGLYFLGKAAFVGPLLIVTAFSAAGQGQPTGQLNRAQRAVT